MTRWLAVAWMFVLGSAFAQVQVADVPARPGVQVRVLAAPGQGGPLPTVILLTGGNGEVGIFGNGSLKRDGNFLVRTRALFAARGHATVVVDPPSDRRDLSGDFRDSAEHAADLGAVVAWARSRYGQPVWVVGTSRGTHSAANAAIRLAGPQAPEGIVLTSTILDSSRFGSSTAKPVQDSGIERVRMPVLVVHHEQDACQVCPPARLPELMRKLPAANSELVMMRGGISRGPLCDAFAHHGFNGIEEQVIDSVSAWIAARK
jgi:dienelactone hydrolase